MNLRKGLDGLLLKCEHANFGYENQDVVIEESLE